MALQIYFTTLLLYSTLLLYFIGQTQQILAESAQGGGFARHAGDSDPLVVLVSEKVISATSVIDIITLIKSLLEKLFYWVTSSMCLLDRVKSARLVSERVTSVLKERCVYYRVTSARFVFDRVTSTWCVSYR